jgi:hypothetical protein
MRHLLLRGALACLLLTPVVGGCVLPPDTAKPSAQMLQADARALVYGRTAGEVLANPQLRDKVQALFGADWAPPTPGGVGKPSLAAPQYFERGGPLRMVHVGDADYIAVTGCAVQMCTGRRGLLLVREGGEALMARIDEGGFLHQYAFGPGQTSGDIGRAGAVLDSAVRELTRASGGDPYPQPAP